MGDMIFLRCHVRRDAPTSRYSALLFDHLVGAGEERRWHSNAKRLGGFHIDDQLETSRLLHRQIGGLDAFEDFVDVDGSLAKKVRIYRGVRHQPAFVDEPARHGNRRHAALQRQIGGALGRQAGLNDDGVGPVSLHRGESAPNSSLLLILIGLIAVPVASPPSWICSRKGLEKGSVALARAVTRRADGSMSRINWTLLPASSAVTLAMPVTFPPGRGRLMTRPVPIGYPVSAITIGISRVACFAATAVGVNQVTMTSTLRRTSSAASSGSRLICPSADRNSNRMFCPSIYPRSRSPCRNSRQNSSGLILPITSAPTVGTFGCCASAASGHAMTVPPTSVMNSRRFIGSPRDRPESRWTGRRLRPDRIAHL